MYFFFSRWLPVHIRDMKNLPESIKLQFEKGLFTVTKTAKKFSSIAIDQGKKPKIGLYKQQNRSHTYGKGQ